MNVIWSFFKTIFILGTFLIIWTFITSSSGVRIDIINKTNKTLTNFTISIDEQKISIPFIKNNSSRSITFDSKYEVESFLLSYEGKSLYHQKIQAYIEKNSPIHIVLNITDEKVDIIEIQHLLLEFHPYEVIKNYWYRFAD